MTALTISVCSAGSDQRQWTVPPKGSIVFGSDHQVADLVIPDQGAAGVVGRVTAAGRHWAIQNATVNTPVLVENASGSDFVSVPAGTEMLVPFTSSRVLVFGSDGIFDFFVQAPARPVRVPVSPRSSKDCASSPLDRNSKYFGVLVALCEPALRYGLLTTLPTSAEIAQRLRWLPSYRSITCTAVDFHVNYLCTRKLQGFIDAYSTIVGAPMPVVARSRRTALVQLALRFDLVRLQDLRLLESGSRQSGLLTRAPRPVVRPPKPRPPG